MTQFEARGSTRIPEQQDVHQVLIIGAGLSGLMAASTLQQHGISTLLLDKGASVGGRLATRRIGRGMADHGAQFFSVRTHAFQQYVHTWLDEDIIYEWSTGWSDGSMRISVATSGYPRYASYGGMNALAKHLAKRLTARIDTLITAVSHETHTWILKTERGLQIRGKHLILTPPVPQSLALLDAGGTSLSQSNRASLEPIQYAPCLAGLFHVDGGMLLPEPGAIQSPEPSVNFIADNKRKGISPDARIITVHASPEFSTSAYDAPENDVLEALWAFLTRWIGSETHLIERQLKKWRYALPLTQHPERALLAEAVPPLVFAGDAFAAPRIEGAVLSGIAAGERLAALIDPAMQS